MCFQSYFSSVIMFQYLFIIISLSGAYSWTDNKQRRFKDDFLFGTASAAYQVEGGWDADGKSESIWDRYVHSRPEITPDGDMACDSYQHISRDVQMLRELGVDFYRFSIAWTRVLPTGFSNKINKKGLQYYNDLIDELIKYNIMPMVTLYHFDLPQSLQDLGGWANPLSINWFEDYARIIYDNFANKVPYFITINQPNSVCIDGYSGSFAPGINSKGIGDYLCVKNVMLAHARAYRLYQNEYKVKYQGSVGIAISVNWVEPINNQTENVKAAEIARDFTIGLYVSPIWSKDGDFPPSVKEAVASRSKEQGFHRSRLPSLTPEEKTLLKGSADFLGMNHYTTVQAQPSVKKYPSPSLEDDMLVDFAQSANWTQGASPWLKSAPFGLYKACVYLNLNYDYPPIIITEHGWSTGLGLRDGSRVENLRGYMTALLFALEDGTNVRGYTAWSLMDNVEWGAGVSERFGLYEVDFDSPKRKRSPRVSAHVYRRIIEQRIIEDTWLPSSLKMDVSMRRMGKDKSEL
ncbi:myrosinase 1 [Amyelois transitella]|uniref:myrosinase 1 n=1 Tax=Amyelois transitella TaxID=680683 RepID=UPI00298F57EA|nr:myrosinase 1 [Amyelois transitella]